MSRICAPVMRNGFPFVIRELAEDGQPFEEWDGSTLCNGVPSKSSNTLITVYGDGSQYCLNVTFAQLVELYWRAKRHNISLELTTGTASVIASASGQSWKVTGPDAHGKYGHSVRSATASVQFDLAFETSGMSPNSILLDKGMVIDGDVNSGTPPDYQDYSVNFSPRQLREQDLLLPGGQAPVFYTETDPPTVPTYSFSSKGQTGNGDTDTDADQGNSGAYVTASTFFNVSLSLGNNMLNPMTSVIRSPDGLLWLGPDINYVASVRQFAYYEAWIYPDDTWNGAVFFYDRHDFSKQLENNIRLTLELRSGTVSGTFIRKDATETESHYDGYPSNANRFSSSFTAQLPLVHITISTNKYWPYDGLWDKDSGAWQG